MELVSDTFDIENEFHILTEKFSRLLDPIYEDVEVFFLLPFQFVSTQILKPRPLPLLQRHTIK